MITRRATKFGIWLILLAALCSPFFLKSLAAQSAKKQNDSITVKFSDIRKQAGITFLQDSTQTEEKLYLETMGTGVAWLDYDQDGLMDLYFVQSGPTEFYKPDHPLRSALYHNNGDGTFTDVSAKAGIANPAGKGLGVVFCDFDRDGDEDIYVANDLVRNFLYRNNGDGTFTDVAYGSGVGFDINGKAQAGMGVDCGDIDDDGFPELFVTNFSEELSTLYLNHRDGTFEDITQKAGLSSGYLPLGFGTKMYDFDNDGDLDLHVTNGHVVDNIKLYQPNLSYEQKDLLYENAGGTFKDISAAAGPALQALRVGRGLAVADYDNDGYVDVVISSVGRRAVLLKNQGARKGNWLEIRAQGAASNSFGLGATVRATIEGRTIVREISNVASYLSSSDTRLHLGLGSAKQIQRVEILWPSGRKQVLDAVTANQIATIREPDK
jgi:hypothetical protein